MADWKNPKLTVDAIVRTPQGIVLVKRGREPFEGMWALPGGFVEYGEDPERAVLREVEEETGLRGKLLGLVGVYGAPSRDPRGHTVSVVYEVEAQGEPRGGDDAAEARAFSLDRLPVLAFDHGRILEDWRARGRAAVADPRKTK
jgi:8-oxo-dGTP diphosphatase